MKILQQNSNYKRASHKFIWGAHRLDLQQNPDLSSEDLGERSDPVGAPGSVSFEADFVSQQVDEAVGGHVSGIGLGQERRQRKRSLKNPTGSALGAPFERDWLNVYRWIEQAAFSKNAILKNIGNTESEIGQALRGSVMVSTGVKSALYDHSYRATMKAISSGGKNSLKKASLNSFHTVKSSILEMFDSLLNDVNIEKYLGKAMLDSNETLKKIIDIRLWRGSTRYPNKAEFLKHHIKKARGEVETSMNYVEDQLKKNINDINAKVETYQTGMRNKNDSVGEGQFMGFVQSVIQNPEGFLSGRITGIVNLENIFGTTNKVKILDALSARFVGKVIELERSQQLTLDQESLIENMDTRERMTSAALAATEFENIHNRLQNDERVQPLDDSEKQDENGTLKTLVKGLREIGINIEADVFLGAPVRMTTSERLILLLHYVGTHQEAVFENQNCQLPFKRTLYTWLQDTYTAQEVQLSQGSVEEARSPEQRRYVLRNAIIVRDSALGAIDSLRDIGDVMRGTDTALVDQRLRSMETFLTSFKQYFGADGVSGDLQELIANMPQGERDILSGMKSFASLYDSLQQTLPLLQEQREKYVTEVLKEMAPDPELLEAEREEARNIIRDMRSMLDNDEPAIVFDQQKYTAMKDAHAILFERVKKWDDARQDMRDRHFSLPADAAAFAGLRMVGTGLQRAFDDIPEGNEAAGHTFDSLMRQHLQNTVQGQKESQFSKSLDANMKHQMDTLLSRKKDADGDFVVEHAPEPGTKIDRLDLANVTNVDGELSFPDSLRHRESFENLTLLRTGLQEENEKYVGADMVFHNDSHIVQIREEKGRVIAESWEKPAIVRRNRNAVIRVPHTQPDSIFVVLNLSTAGTVASTRARGGHLRVVDEAE